MIYAFITIAVLIVALLVLRLRLRLEISSDRKLLFAGLGQTGPEFDFRSRTGVVRLFGLRTKQFRLGGRKPEKKEREADKARRAEKKPPKAKRKRSPKEIVKILPQCLRALGKYLLGLLKAAIVEQAEGEIEAGFDAPHLTGELFGFYQAALAAAPGVVGRVRYIPDWTGQSFSGSVRCSVAWPVYKLIWQTTLLVFRLPVRKIIKLAIGTKEGVQDG